MAKGLKPKQTELEVAEDEVLDLVNGATDNPKPPIAKATAESCNELYDGICITKGLVSKLYNLFNGTSKEITLRKLWLAKRWFEQECNAAEITLKGKSKAGATSIGLLSNAKAEAAICLGEINQLLSSNYFKENKNIGLVTHFPKTKEYLTEARFAIELYIEDVNKTIAG
jgi:hypothetical protein